METTSEQQALIQAAREQALTLRWSRGRPMLSLLELGEIRPLIGEAAYKRGLADLGIADAPVGLSGRWPYKAQLQHYASVFEHSIRQLKRWIAKGRNADPPELPPLDDPAKLRDWWARHMTQRCPAKILALALEGARVAPSGPKSIDVTLLTMAEGEPVRQARSFLAAAAQSLQAAYRGDENGVVNDAELDRAQRRWDRAAEALKKAEASDRAAAKQRGDLIPKGELFADLSQLLEIQRTMRLTMSRRIRSRLPGLPAEWSDRLDEVIELERSREESVLRRLKYFPGMREIELELEAA